MDENVQDIDYPYPEITIKRGYLEVIDRVLLAASGRMWELLRDIAPYNRQVIQTWSYSPEELRTSYLGQSLLTIADYAGGGVFTGLNSKANERLIERINSKIAGWRIEERHLPLWKKYSFGNFSPLRLSPISIDEGTLTWETARAFSTKLSNSSTA